MNYSIFLLLAALMMVVAGQTNGTQAYYISPDSLSRAYDIQASLQQISQGLTASNISYNSSGIRYSISNVTMRLVFNGGKQKAQIKAVNDLFVGGGRIQFIYNFNFTKAQNGKPDIAGSAFGSVLSNSIQYGKQFSFNDKSFISWKLTDWSQKQTNVSFSQKFKIKRLEPFQQADINNLQLMLSGGENVQPATLQIQLTTNVNKIFIQALNNTLNHESAAQEIVYNYADPYRGQLQITIVHQMKQYLISPNDGAKLIYLTHIKDYGVAKCNVSVPDDHMSFQYYGSLLNLHLNCLYESVIDYILGKGWLDSELDERWQTNAFQFYAGDLYDLINNLYLRVDARSALVGKCKPKPSFTFKDGRDYLYGTYSLEMTYDCLVSSVSKEKTKIDILNFTVGVRYLIKPSSNPLTLEFKVVEANATKLQFIPVENFFVSNINLATFKISQGLKSFINHTTFGTGYPSIPTQYPATSVTANYVIYSDASHARMDYE